MTRGPDKQFDREEVLRKAMELFWSQGYEATGMAELTEYMGIGRQSLYDTFGDKRSLLLAALKQYVESEIRPMVTMLKSPGSPMGNFRELLGRWSQMARDGSGCMVGNCLAEFGSKDDEIARLLDHYLRMMEDAFTSTFERAKEAGELRPEVNSRDLARTILAMGQGTALLTKVRRDPALVRSVVDASLAMLGAA
jgi:TetR/AcrR family transcriptional repressor of nem operon